MVVICYTYRAISESRTHDSTLIDQLFPDTPRKFMNAFVAARDRYCRVISQQWHG